MPYKIRENRRRYEHIPLGERKRLHIILNMYSRMLASQRYYSTQELMKLFNIGQKQVHKYIVDMENASIPVQVISDRNGMLFFKIEK